VDDQGGSIVSRLKELLDGQQPPPWNWQELTAEERRAELEDLAEWVAELQEGYGRWVRIPPCWPLHRALLEELAVFWYWRQRLDQAGDALPEEAVRWHQALRMSARDWAEAFGGCRHASTGEVDERRDGRQARLEASRRYLDQAIERLTG